MNIRDCSVHFAGGVNVVVRAVTGPVVVVAVADVVIGAVLAIFSFLKVDSSRLPLLLYVELSK